MDTRMNKDIPDISDLVKECKVCADINESWTDLIDWKGLLYKDGGFHPYVIIDRELWMINKWGPTELIEGTQ